MHFDPWIVIGTLVVALGLALGWAAGQYEDLQREREEARRTRRWTR